MNWQAQYLESQSFPYIQDKLALFRKYKPCKEHILKHVLNSAEPWQICFSQRDYLNVHQLTGKEQDEQVLAAYQQLLPEIKKAITATFVYGWYGYLKQHKTGAKVYGISPQGYIFVLSKFSLLTIYYPVGLYSVDRANARIFLQSKKILERKIKTTQKKEAKKSEKDITSIALDVSFFNNSRSFKKFLSAYNNIQGTDIEVYQQLQSLK